MMKSRYTFTFTTSHFRATIMLMAWEEIEFDTPEIISNIEENNRRDCLFIRKQFQRELLITRSL